MASRISIWNLFLFKSPKFCFYRLCVSIILCMLLLESCVSCLHLQGTWHSGEFFKFLAKFGFQKTSEHDKLNTQGYIYGNITSSVNSTAELTLVVVDSEYFLHFYGNRSVLPRSNACAAMFGKIEHIAWDYTCNPTGKEDFVRKIPCPIGKLCADEDTPKRVVPGYQFTYAVQDTNQPRFWYVSMVSCLLNDTVAEHCTWGVNQQDLKLQYDIWFVNGNPFTKQVNPFEHQFSFELHDVFEIYLAFFVVYTFLVPIQLYALSRQKHTLPLILTTCLMMEYIGVVFNFAHIFKFAFDGVGVDMLHVVGDFVDQIAQCVFMLLLLLIVKGWTITRAGLPVKDKIVLFSLWGAYTVSNLCLFTWNLMEIDFISDTDEWQTWPGYLILAFRILIMAWFLYELKEIFVLERHREKTRFYLHFGAGFLVWFVYLPILAVIGTQVSALWRHKTILSVTYSADFVSYAVLIHLLWPSRSYVYFNLVASGAAGATPRPFSLDELEFPGLNLAMDDIDSASEESVGSDIEETSELIVKSTRWTNNVDNEHLPDAPEHCDSGIESVTNGDAHHDKGAPLTAAKLPQE